MYKPIGRRQMTARQIGIEIEELEAIQSVDLTGANHDQYSTICFGAYEPGY